MRIVYITRHFNHSGYLVLQELIRQKFNIVAVVVHQQDSWLLHPILKYLAVGLYRLKCLYYRCDPLKTTASEELLARKHGLKCLRVKSLKDEESFRQLKELEPDLMILGGGWHELLPARIFQIPRLGSINTHPSLLPHFRGTSAARWQILHGTRVSGTTIHKIDEQFDTGQIIKQKKLVITEKMPPQSLFYKLGQLGAEAMVELLKEIYQDGWPRSDKSTHQQAGQSYFQKWQWSENGLLINWNQTFEQIEDFVLASTQESYEYLGPIFKLSGQSYFLRKCRLHSKEYCSLNLEAFDHRIRLVAIKNGEFYLFRKGEDSMLVIELVQKFDHYSAYRRAKKPKALLKKCQPRSPMEFEL